MHVPLHKKCHVITFYKQTKQGKFVVTGRDELATLLAMYMGVELGKPSPDSKRPISSGVRGQLPFMRKFSGLYRVLLTPRL